MKRYLIEFFGRENDSGGRERFLCLGIYAADPSQIRPIISQTHEYWHISRVAIVEGGPAAEPDDVRWTLCAHGERYDYFTALEPVYERWYFTWALKGSVPVHVSGGYYSLGSLARMKNDNILIDLRKGKS
mgnify:CR=1 FL=1